MADLHEIPDPVIDLPATGSDQIAIVAGGCFWCVEAVFEQIDGITDAESGYAGGPASKANYRAVCDGNTGHAEVVRVRFDPAKITYGQVLKLFFAVAHDPTQLNRQGADVGTQYRSEIFTLDDDQKRVAEAYIEQLNAANAFGKPIVTKVSPLEAFYPAEDYHQDYASANPSHPYIVCSVGPKMQKLVKSFANRLRQS